MISARFGLSRRLVLLAIWLVATIPAAAGAVETKTAVAAFALWSGERVFASEASQAAGLLARRFGAVETVIRSNTRARLDAGPAGMIAAIAQAERALDPERDVLIVMLTSHGSPDGIAEQGGGVEGLLSPRTLGAILAKARTRHKVLIVSACYSGIFTALAGPDLLVITAADATHPSFGCTATARWTYFGEAFFSGALRASLAAHAPLANVFAQAAGLVRARETREGFEPSNPQIAGGSAVLPALAP